MRSTPKTAKIPVLTLYSAVMGEWLEDGSAAWPSRIDKLAHEVEAALRADPEDGAMP